MRRRRHSDNLPGFVKPLVIIMICITIVLGMAYMLLNPPEHGGRTDKADEGIAEEPGVDISYAASEISGLYLPIAVIQESSVEDISRLLKDMSCNSVVVERKYTEGITDELRTLVEAFKGKGVYVIAKVAYVEKFGSTDSREQVLEDCMSFIELGVDEINLDYVGDTVGDETSTEVGEAADDGDSADVFVNGRLEFIKYVDAAVGDKVKLSADLYIPYHVSSAKKEEAAAELKELLGCVDTVCPVFYPAYYEFEQGLSMYDKTKQLVDAMEEIFVLAEGKTDVKNVKVTAWVQAFDISVEQKNEIVRALTDKGIGGRLEYNAQGEYGR